MQEAHNAGKLPPAILTGSKTEHGVDLTSDHDVIAAPRVEQEQASSAGAPPADNCSLPPAATPQPTARRKRAAQPTYDNIWTRNHGISMLAAVYDDAVGWPDKPRVALTPFTGGMKPKDVGTVVIQLCPWLLNPIYMNFQGSAGLEEDGLESYFKSWAANRVYCFYYDPAHSEHPANRTKGGLSLVYGEFWETFSPRVQALSCISEAEAREFWLSVSDRVPFQFPPKVQITATSVVTVEGGQQ